MNGPALSGKSVLLRPIAAADNPRLVAWRNSDDVRLKSFNQPPFTLEKQETWYAQYLHDPGQIRFIIEHRELGPVGCCGLTDIRREEATAALAIYLGEPAARGRGLAREALELLIAYAWRDLRLHRITAEVFADNPAAAKLYEKAGFVQEGRLRQAHLDARSGARGDVLVMGLLAPKS